MLVPSGDSNILQRVVLGLLDHTNPYPQIFIYIMNRCHMIQKGFIKETFCVETVFFLILCIYHDSFCCMLCFGSTAVCIVNSMKANEQSSTACNWYCKVC